MIQILQRLAVPSLSKKRQYFCQIFQRNYFKNHNIGPRFSSSLFWAFLKITGVANIFCFHSTYKLCMYYVTLTKHELGYTLGDFLKNTSGHTLGYILGDFLINSSGRTAS
jgi:hypothetical protein